VIGWKEVAGTVTEKGGYERDYVQTVLDAWEFVPGATELGNNTGTDWRQRLQQELDDTVKGALAYLNDPNCARAVAGEVSNADPTALLNHLKYNYRISIYEPDLFSIGGLLKMGSVSDAIAFTEGTGKNAAISVTNLFFTPGRAGEVITVDRQAIALSFRDAQILTILHEVSHAIGDNIHGREGKIGRFVAWLSGHKQAISTEKLDERIYNGCFKPAPPKNVGD
jgi:hypothetical protein